MKLFSSGDFIKLLDILGPSPMMAAEIANKILNEYLEKCPVGYGNGGQFDIMVGVPDSYIRCKYKATLFNIEEINKQPETLYVDSGITMNGETLYKKVVK